MATKKIRYLLEEKGRYYYQRKIPKSLSQALKADRWHLPVGSDFESATDRIKELKKEHDALIAGAKTDPSKLVALRREAEAAQTSKEEAKAAPIAAMLEAVRSGEIDCYPARVELAFQDALATDAVTGWKTTPDVLADLQEARKPSVDLDLHTRRKATAGPVTEAEYSAAIAPFAGIASQEYFEKWRKFVVGADNGFAFKEVRGITDDEFADRLQDHLKAHFKPSDAPPDEDDRLEFDMHKIKLERLVARYAPEPDKLSSIFARFLAFNDIKTEPKYRRSFAIFLQFAQDIPIHQVTTKLLRGYRDKLLADGLSTASVQAAFTPIKSLFRYAIDEEIIDSNPARDISFPKDNRPVGEIKHLAFTQDEMKAILSAIDVWREPSSYLSDDRRIAMRHIVRALAFTAARPVELMSLKPQDVTDAAINIRRTKTKSSWRFIPVHPEIADFPAFVRSGGIECLRTNNQDTVDPVRYNFMRILRETMTPPVTEPRKTLYSFRGTFQDAMRRAGAPLEVRQAILGHTQGGAIKHYDSGPEFELMQKWVFAADPRV